MPPPNQTLIGAPRRPVTSSKGGYLRCPFDISARFSQLAERHVTAGIASAKTASAMREDKDGIEEPLGKEGGRPWTRAGVGAGHLSAKEKRLQQEQAEKIYGAESKSLTADETSETNHFAVDLREQEALKRVLPRHVRLDKRRRRDRDDSRSSTEEGGKMMMFRREVATAEDSDEAILAKAPNTGRRKAEQTRDETVESRAAESGRSSGKPDSVVTTDTEDVVTSKSSTRPSAPLRARGLTTAQPARTLNRMQKLEELRQAALMGKKKRR